MGEANQAQRGCFTEDEVLDLFYGTTERASGPAFDVHLEACPRCRVFIGEAAGGATASPGRRSFPLQTFADGARVGGRYDILGFVARGGMGEVYQARDRFLSQVVALKTLTWTSLDDARAIARLKEEVMLARRVSHPNVCRILEFGVHEEPDARNPTAAIPFLTMELLSGQTLGQRVRATGAMPLSRTRPLVLQMMAGLEAVHHAGIVHRDFKSDNVYLVPDAEGGERAVVMDFGLARPLEARARSFTGDVVVGTLDYMAPEQIHGAPPSKAVDVYALGVVIYEMLTGRPPFAGVAGLGAAVKKVSGAPPPPSRAGADSEAWDALTLRCLARDPAKRFPSIAAARTALEALPSESRRTRAVFSRRTRAVLAAAVTAALVFGGGLSASRTPPESPAAPASSEAKAPHGHSLVPASPAPMPSLSVAPLPSLSPPVVPAALVPAVAPHARPRAVSGPARRSAGALGRRARGESPQDPAILIGRSEQLLLDGQGVRACELGTRAAALAPAAAELQLFLGRCYMRLAKPREARVHYRRFLDLAPNAPEAVFVRAIVEKSR